MKAIASESHEPVARRGGWAAALMDEESDAEVPDGPDASQAEMHAAETQKAAANSEKEELAKTVMAQTMLMQQLQTQMQQAAMAQVVAAQSSNMRSNIPGGPPGGGGSVNVPEKNLQRAKQYQTLMSASDRGRNEEIIFVGGLRKSTEENQVFSHFSKYGEVESVDVKRTADGVSRGFAFVKFKHKDGVDKSLEQKASHMIDNKWLAVRRRDDQSAHAGRAASIAKAAAPKQVEEAPPEPEDREEDFTNKYLTMAQQLGMAQQQEEQQQVVGIVGAPVMMVSPMMSPMMASPMMGGPVMGQPNMMGNPMGASVRMEPYRNTR